MKKNICCIVLLLYGICEVAMGQVKALDSVAPVYVGGKLPPAIYDVKNKVLTGGVLSEASLAKDFDKLIVIDFWASWCGSCLKKFPLLEKIQVQYPEDIKVLLVNSVGTGDSTRSLMEKVKAGSAAGAVGETGLSFVVEDKLFLSAFPHRAIPHYVWIIGGAVAGITSSDFLTEENIIMMVERNRKHVLIASKSKKNKKAGE